MIRRIDYGFLFLGVASALTGMVLGIVMGIREDFSLAPVHAHINLVGFVALTLFGIAYRIGWAAKDVWALVHFVLAGTGAVMLAAGIAVAMASHQPAIAIIGSLLTFASMLLFLVNCARAWRAGDVRRRPDVRAAGPSAWSAFPDAAPRPQG